MPVGCATSVRYAFEVASIVVIGAGAVGSYYGALLARAGHEVRFVMRRDLEAVRRSGLHIESPKGDFHLPNVSVFATPHEAGIADWVICSLKATAIGDAAALIRPCVGPTTRIVALMNGLGVEQVLAQEFEPRRIFGVMAFVCINRGEPGRVRHLDYGRVTLGHFPDEPLEAASLKELFDSAGIENTIAPNLRYARWEKLCWNVPFNGLSVAAGGVGTQEILRDPGLRAVADAAMREVVATGNADLESAGSSARLDETDILQRMFAQTDTMGDYRTSMVIDFVMGRPLEVEAILGETHRRADELNVSAPTIRTLYALVRIADLQRRGVMAPLSVADIEAE